MKNSKFQTRLSTMFIHYTIIPLLITIVFFSISAFVISLYYSEYQSANAANKTLEQVEMLLEKYTIFLENLAEDEMMEELFTKNVIDTNTYERYYAFNATMSIKSSIRFYDNYGEQSTINVMDYDTRNQEIPYYLKRKLEQNTQGIILDTHFSKVERFTIGKVVLNKTNDEIIGYILIHLNNENLQELLTQFRTDSLVITDNFDNILSTSENSLMDVLGKIKTRLTSSKKVTINNRAYYQIIAVNPSLNIKVYALTRTLNYGILICWIIIISFFLTIGLQIPIKYLAKKIAENNAISVNKLIENLDNMKLENLKPIVDIKTTDEFEYIAEKYNEMIHELNHQILEKEELTHIISQNEMKFLQSQFNPHFLFNMLETIKYVMFEDTKKAKEIIVELSYLLRYSISNIEQIIPLEVDLQYTERYLKLHKFRYLERLTYSIKVSDGLKKQPIPKFLLQPLLENSIKYGYKTTMKLAIAINIVCIDNKIVFTISDNGGGITKQRIEKIRQAIEQDELISIGNGLSLTDKKIKLLYGNQYGLRIISDSKTYTKIQLSIPVAKRGD